MQHKVIPVGYLSTNCTIVWGDDKNGIVCDPGDRADLLIDFIKQNEINVQYVLLTHNHFDHTGALPDVLEQTGAKLAVGELDADGVPVSPDILLKDGDKISFGELEIAVVFTPGHTRGGVCYIVGDIMLSGDTLFCEDIGRSDLPGGSFSVLKKSLQKIKNLPFDDLKIIPGHEETTTLSHERKHNMYLR